MDSITKKCSMCGEIKHISNFKKDIRYTDDHIGQCKACRNKRNVELRKITGKKYDYPEKRKELYNKSIEERRAYTRKWCKENKEKKAQMDREYRQTNAQKISEHAKIWRENNKEKISLRRKESKEQRKVIQWNRRSRKLSSGGRGVTKEQWERLKSDYCYRCAYCGEQKRLTLEHIVPLCDGGEHDIDNSAPVCQSCNSSKGKKSMLSFMYRRMFYK